MKSFDFKNLGKYLKEKRIARGLTQSDLAQKLKIHSQFVSNWERGICAPPNHCIQQALDILKVDRNKVVAAMLLDSKRIIEAKVFT